MSESEDEYDGLGKGILLLFIVYYIIIYTLFYQTEKHYS